MRVPPGFRGTAVQVRLHETGCRIPSSLSGAPGPKSHPFSASGWQQRRQAAGGDAARVHHEICSQQDWWGSQVKTAMTCAGEGGVKARCSVRSVTIRGFSSSPLSLSFLSDLAVPSVGTHLPGFAISSPAIALLQILTPLLLPAEHLLNQTTPHSSISPQRSQQRENLQIPRVHPSPLILAGRFTLSSSSMSH